MNLLAAIMTSPDFAEVMFLVAFILFLVEAVVCIARPAAWVYTGLVLALGFAAVALGLLAL